MSFGITWALMSCMLAVGQAEPKGPAPKTPLPPSVEEIRQAVQQLGDDKFAVREKASQFLWKAGKAAEPALRKALNSDDPEVVARVKNILRRFDAGIFPDTPPELVKTIESFRFGNQSAQSQILKDLMAKNQVRTVLRLLKLIKDEKFRERLVAQLLGDNLVGKVLAAGEIEQAGELLELGATGEAGARNLAAFLLLHGGLEPRIAAVRARWETAKEPHGARLLFYLLRAKGDLPAALAVAKAAGETALLKGALYELSDWKELAKLETNPAGIERLGYAAAFHRLAGNKQELAKLVGGIKTYSLAQPGDAWYVAEALFLNDEVEAGIEEVKKSPALRAHAFRLLLVQLRYRDAFQHVGLERPEAADEWFAKLSPQAKSKSSEWNLRFELGVLVARTLHRLGQKKESGALFTRMTRDALAAGDGNPILNICAEELRLGLEKDGLAHAAEALAHVPAASLLKKLIPNQASAADMLWQLFQVKHVESDEDRLARLWKLLAASHRSETSDEQWDAIWSDWEKHIDEQIEGAARPAWWRAMAATCQMRDQPARALKHLNQAAAQAADAALHLQVSDLLAKQGKWAEAATAYEQAWQADKNSHLAMHLWGRALVESGRKEEGEAKLKVAVLMPLADSMARHTLATELEKRGHVEAALQQRRMILRTAAFDDWAVGSASIRIARELADKDRAASVNSSVRQLLRVLRRSTRFTQVESYLRVPQDIHRNQAKVLLAAGQVDEAMQEAWLSHRGAPGDADLSEELVPLLEKAGRKNLADEVFAKVYAANKTALEAYPDSPLYLNQVAWVNARCGRNLDEALGQATRAVKLEPRNPSYTDTLAEVHFRRGDRDEAVRWQRRAVKLAPDNPLFRQRLKEFQGE